MKDGAHQGGGAVRPRRASPAARATKLLADVVSRRRSPKTLLYAGLSRFSRLTRSLRYDFERLYLGNPDPWGYLTSDYEQRKYQHVLARIMERRRGARAVLEIGCSIGVFSAMLAGAFDEVTAVDLSAEALAVARTRLAGRPNVRLLRSDLRSLRLRSRFDVIVCAEVLYFLPRRAADAVVRMLRRHLEPEGVVVMVSGKSQGRGAPRRFYDWRPVLGGAFDTLLEETVEDGHRPYEVTVYGQREAGRGAVGRGG